MWNNNDCTFYYEFLEKIMRDFCEELVDETDYIKIKIGNYKKIVESPHQSTHLLKTKTKRHPLPWIVIMKI